MINSQQFDNTFIISWEFMNFHAIFFRISNNFIHNFITISLEIAWETFSELLDNLIFVWYFLKVSREFPKNFNSDFYEMLNVISFEFQLQLHQNLYLHMNFMTSNNFIIVKTYKFPWIFIRVSVISPWEFPWGCIEFLKKAMIISWWFLMNFLWFFKLIS